MDFNIRNHAVLNIGGVEVWITETIVNTWIVMGILVVFGLIVRAKLKSFAETPKGFQNFIELLVETFDGFLNNTAGKHLSFLGPWFFTVFAFIMLSNFSGLFFLRPPTADWATTFAAAISTFILIQVMGLKFRGTGYIKTFFEPIWVFFPLNVIGEIARPISLSFRLFGNILGGMIILALFYNQVPIFFQFGFPIALHVFFDLVYGVLQTYIFCVLSLSFIGVATNVASD